MDALELMQKSIDASKDNLRELSEKVAGMGKQITENVKGDFDEKFSEINAKLAEIEQKQALQQTAVQAVESKGDIVDLMFKNRGTKHFEVKDTLTSSMIGGAVEFLGVKTDSLKRFTILDLLPVRYRKGLLYTYDKLDFENKADVVGEGQMKPASLFSGTPAELALRKIAHYTKVTLEADLTLEEAEEDVRQIVRTRLYNGIINSMEWQAINGDGVTQSAYGGTQWNGLLGQATAFDDSVLPTDATKIDALRLAMAQVVNADGWASGVFLNNTDWALIEVAKNQNGVYFVGNPISGTTEKRLWGLPVVDIQAIPQNNFIVGAFNQGAAELIIQRRGVINIDGLAGDDLINNKFTMVSEIFGNVAVERPAQVIKGTFA